MADVIENGTAISEQTSEKEKERCRQEGHGDTEAARQRRKGVSQEVSHLSHLCFFLQLKNLQAVFTMAQWHQKI